MRIGNAIFAAGPGSATDGHADEVAGRLERRVVDRRRIDAHLRALAQQIADQPVERLVGAVADIIVIAREQGDAEVARLHRQQPLTAGAAKAMHGRHDDDSIKTGLAADRPARRAAVHPRQPAGRRVARGAALLCPSAQPVLAVARRRRSARSLHALAYEERLERLAERGIGLWDVVGSAGRRGSLDQAIRVASAQPARAASSTTSPSSRRSRSTARPRRGWAAGCLASARRLDADRPAVVEPRLHPCRSRTRREAWAVLGEFRRLALARAQARHIWRMMTTTDERRSRQRQEAVDGRRGAGRRHHRQHQRPAGDPRQAGRQGRVRPRGPQAFSDSYSKPLDHEGMRENELVSQMQDQMEATLAELMRFLSERGRRPARLTNAAFSPHMRPRLAARPLRLAV